MAGRIPRHFIDEMIARADIVDFIDARIKLKKKGKDYRACCPFHNGNNDSSFSVSSERQFYHCFNCGVSGNIISFIMEYDNIEFVDAIETLAEEMGIEVLREKGAYSNDHTKPSYGDTKDLYALMNEIAIFYQKQLRYHKNSSKVISYLKNRGLTGETAKYFKIGYAPEGWDELRKQFATTSLLEKQLIEAGMLIAKENRGSYDRFRDRLMFPILDKRGRIIGFGGRVFDDSEPKYLNSPETANFHKGKELYGLYQVKQTYKKIERILVVEGYMDVVALKQFGIDYAVASLGTSTTPVHIHSLFRHTSEIVCCFDGDKAGNAAASRALENSLPYLKGGQLLRFMFVPDGEDPDSLVQKKGKEHFENLIKKAMPLSDFLFQHLLSQVDMTMRDSKPKLAALAAPLFNKLTDIIFKQMMTERLCQLLGIEEDAFLKLLVAPTAPENKNETKKSTPMRSVIAIVLQYPELVYALPEFPEFQEISVPGMRLLNELLAITRSEKEMTTARLLERWRGKPEEQHLKKLAMLEIKSNYEQEFFDILDTFFESHIVNKIEQLKQKERTGEKLTMQEKQQLSDLLLSK